jgi:hypothetical protein
MPRINFISQINTVLITIYQLIIIKLQDKVTFTLEISYSLNISKLLMDTQTFVSG